ncbi:MAG: hypothetical protein ACI87E_003077 [Mariniblastus sp.]|jgi:hypothetical protein
MDAILPILIFGGVIVLAGGAFYWAHVLQKKRREAFEATAESMGLVFFPDGNQDLLTQLGDFKLFNQGRSRKMRNLIQGDSGEVSIAIFDYQYTTGSGKQSHTHVQSVVALQSNEIVCPDFTMRPESMFDRVGSALGFQDIDFDSHPEFSKRFVLKGSNEPAIREFFTQIVLDFFAAQPGISVEAQSGSLFFYRSGKKIKPDEVKDNLGQAYEVFGMLAEAQDA